MPVTIRNPFRKAAPPALLNTASDSAVLHRNQAGSSTSSLGEEETRSTPATGAPSRSASAISIADDDRNSYKMSVVNDSGIYLPPSPPPEKKGIFWRRNESSNSLRNRPPVAPSDEPFAISRESFDSYRRSFDISARSPISEYQATSTRTSLDPGFAARPTRSSFDVRPSRMSFDAPPRMSLDSRRSPSSRTPPEAPLQEVKETDMTEFEDVKLDEDPKPRSSRLNIFHRFDKPAAGASNGVQGTHHRAESGMTRLFGGGRKHEIAPVPESELKSIGGMESSKATPVSVE